MKRIAYMLGAIVMSFGMLTGFNVWYTNHVQSQSEQRYVQLLADSEKKYRTLLALNNKQWCNLLVGIDAIYTNTPPTTLTGKQFAAGIHTLTLTFAC
jgi:hypothetical protein